jgi:iron complex outermembrane receptor protein
MLPQMILVFWTINYEWDNNSVLQAGLRLTIEKNSYRNGTMGEEGYFKAVDKSFDSFKRFFGLQNGSC